MAVWRSVVMHRYQDAPPIEFLHEGCVHDPIKTFNVYGYGMCCCASCNIEALARYVGPGGPRLGASTLHSVPEVFYDNAWHMFDASLVNYFPKPDGKIASVEEIVAAVKGWLEKHPEYRKNDAKLRQFHQAGGWMGWKNGPELLANCPFYDWRGWWPAKTHGWYSTMQEFDGTRQHAVPLRVRLLAGLRGQHPAPPRRAAHAQLVQQGPARQRHPQGRRRPGLPEREDRRGLHGLPAPSTATSPRAGSAAARWSTTCRWPTARSARGALAAENLASKSEDNGGPGPARQGRRAARRAGDPHAVELRVPRRPSSPWTPSSARAASVRVLFSDNNGLDWKDVATLDEVRPAEDRPAEARPAAVRLPPAVRPEGPGHGPGEPEDPHSIQCSQRALPTLAKGENTITFSAGPQEGTDHHRRHLATATPRGRTSRWPTSTRRSTTSTRSTSASRASRPR